jgi:hypothetical protein
MNDLSSLRAKEAFDASDDDSYGVVRILNSSAGSPGDERAYEVGDEALVEHGLAEWVVAPVHNPSAGRRLDHDAAREPTPLGGVEAYPPAEPTTSARRVEARQEGFVDAHVHEGLGEKLAARRVEVARDLAEGDGEGVRAQLALGSLSARSGPVTARSDLAADVALAEASAAAADEDGEPAGQPAAQPARSPSPSPSPSAPTPQPQPRPAASPFGGEKK